MTEFHLPWPLVSTVEQDWRDFFHLLCHNQTFYYHALAVHVNRLVRGSFPLLNWPDMKEWIEEGDRQLVWARVLLMLPKHDAWAKKMRDKKAKKRKQTRDRKHKERSELFAEIARALETEEI